MPPLISALSIALAFVFPGVMDDSSLKLDKPGQESIDPPVDEHGSRQQLTGRGATATAEVFWEEPGRARVSFKIEIPPKAASASK
jgi:hypothetical protein